MLKVNAKDFKQLLDEFKLSNTMEIIDGVFKFTDDEVIIEQFAPPQICRSKLVLKKEFFIEYEKLENIGIGSISEFVALIGKFKKDIIISVEGNLLTISEGKRIVESELVDEQFITDPTEMNVEYTNSFVMPINILKDIFETKSIKENKLTTMTIKTEENKVSYKTKGKYKFSNEFEIEGITEENTSTFGVPFFEALEKFVGKGSKTENLLICIGDNYPLTVIKSGTNYEMTILIAPHNEEEE